MAGWGIRGRICCFPRLQVSHKIEYGLQFACMKDYLQCCRQTLLLHVNKLSYKTNINKGIGRCWVPRNFWENVKEKKTARKRRRKGKYFRESFSNDALNSFSYYNKRRRKGKLKENILGIVFLMMLKTHSLFLIFLYKD